MPTFHYLLLISYKSLTKSLRNFFFFICTSPSKNYWKTNSIDSRGKPNFLQGKFDMPALNYNPIL